MRRPFLALTLLLLLFVAACGDAEEPIAGTEGGNIGDRYLRLIEVRDIGASLFVYEGELPPNLAELLNPGMTADTPLEDLVSVPVPEGAVLLGSYHIRRRDGANEIWLAYDMPGSDVDIERIEHDLMDQTPWQVTGGQSNEVFAIVSFQSTVSGDIEGFVTIQALPSTPSFTVTVERDGQTLELELARGAFIPEIDARFRELRDGLEVTDVLSDDQLHEGDLLVAVGDVPVVDQRDLFAAFRALGVLGEPRSALLYRLTVVSPVTVEDRVFVLPAARPLPEGFPAEFLVSDDLSVVDISWDSQTSGEIYQIRLLTERSAFDVAEDYRDALASAGWNLVSDEAQGFGTVLNFEDAANGVVGIASIDQFPDDEELNSVILQIQVGRGTN